MPIPLFIARSMLFDGILTDLAFFIASRKAGFISGKYDEISEELELPLGTIKAQLHRAREQLFNIVSGKKESL